MGARCQHIRMPNRGQRSRPMRFPKDLCPFTHDWVQSVLLHIGWCAPLCTARFGILYVLTYILNRGKWYREYLEFVERSVWTIVLKFISFHGKQDVVLMSAIGYTCKRTFLKSDALILSQCFLTKMGVNFKHIAMEQVLWKMIQRSSKL